jgi:DNA invertase Pin-like site-specific DNA recombinase
MPLIVDIYLRKSRADEELEKTLGQGETLARHRKVLLRLAKEESYTIHKIHEELVSGEELFFRPAMLEVLKDVEAGLCEGVLVMDIQRLGRGDMEEQGIILKTFKKSNAKIITPKKTYDLNDEFDEEYSEFEAFMSRKEYKMINKRLQGGRTESVMEGNYIATRPPYGYDIVRIDKKTRVLKPNPEQSKVIQMIFDWYVNQNMGCSKIGNELDRLGIKSYTGKKWDKSSITNYLKNPVYIGKIVWKKKCIRKSKTPGKKRDVYTRPQEEWIISEGKHPAIIDESIFNKAQELLACKYHVPYQLENGVTNPLAGLLICDKCGAKMIKRPVGKKPPRIMCPKNCGQKSNFFKSVEELILKELEEYYNNLLVDASNKKTDIESTVEFSLLEKNIANLENESKTLEQQRVKTFDLLEQGIYDVATFTERSTSIQERLEVLQSSIGESKNQILQIKSTNAVSTEYLTMLRSVLDAYYKIDSPEDKNLLLKSILIKVGYNKEPDAKVDNFRIKLYPKISHF